MTFPTLLNQDDLSPLMHAEGAWPVGLFLGRRQLLADLAHPHLSLLPQLDPPEGMHRPDNRGTAV